MKKEKASKSIRRPEFKKAAEDIKKKATRPLTAKSPNMGFHGKDEERELNPEE